MLPLDRLSGRKTTLLLYSEPITGELVKRAWRIEVSKGPDRGKSLVRESGTITVGSDPESDLALTDPSVSRRHAILELLPEGVVVVDQGSSNGTRVGNARIERALVTAGTGIGLGRTRLDISTEDQTVRLDGGGGEGFREMITEDPGLTKTLARLELVAQTDVTVLLEGEIGTGRRMMARLIHTSSSRSTRPLVVLDCDAWPEQEIEARLFDALEKADGGTIVLAEVGSLPLAMQARVLEVIETKSVRRFSQSGAARHINVRFMFTTRPNLEARVKSGEFREDLYYRAAVVRAVIPPLRARPGDITRLARHFAQAASGGRARLSAETVRMLADYDWPANVRELSTVIERAVACSRSGEITPEEILPEALERPAEPFHEAKEAVIAEFERRYVRTLLAKNDGNVSHAARDAGLSRGAFYALMKRAGIEV